MHRVSPPSKDPIPRGIDEGDYNEKRWGEINRVFAEYKRKEEEKKLRTVPFPVRVVRELDLRYIYPLMCGKDVDELRAEYEKTANDDLENICPYGSSSWQRLGFLTTTYDGTASHFSSTLSKLKQKANGPRDSSQKGELEPNLVWTLDRISRFPGNLMDEDPVDEDYFWRGLNLRTSLVVWCPFHGGSYAVLQTLLASDDFQPCHYCSQLDAPQRAEQFAKRPIIPHRAAPLRRTQMAADDAHHLTAYPGLLPHPLRWLALFDVWAARFRTGYPWYFEEADRFYTEPATFHRAYEIGGIPFVLRCAVHPETRNVVDFPLNLAFLSGALKKEMKAKYGCRQCLDSGFPPVTPGMSQWVTQEAKFRLRPEMAWLDTMKETGRMLWTKLHS